GKLVISPPHMYIHVLYLAFLAAVLTRISSCHCLLVGASRYTSIKVMLLKCYLIFSSFFSLFFSMFFIEHLGLVDVRSDGFRRHFLFVVAKHVLTSFTRWVEIQDGRFGGLGSNELFSMIRIRGDGHEVNL
ncbi:hypothetical protein ACJX0J_030026, partial [Zea mays]